MIVDGVYLEETTNSSPPQGFYYWDGADIDLNAADAVVTQAMVVYHADPAGNNWSDVRDAIQAIAIRGRDAKVEIGANDIPRIQSITINGNLNVQPVREMGNRVIVGYQRQVPSVDGTITVLDTDVELLALLTEGSIAPSGITEFEIAGGCAASGVNLKIHLYDPCEDQTTGNVLKTVYIPEVVVTGDAYTANVNDNVQQTFNFRSNTAECIVYSGYF